MPSADRLRFPKRSRESMCMVLVLISVLTTELLGPLWGIGVGLGSIPLVYVIERAVFEFLNLVLP